MEQELKRIDMTDMTEAAKSEAVQAIVANSGCNFLYLELLFEEIQADKSLLGRLDRIPRKLEDLFDNMLERVILRRIDGRQVSRHEVFQVLAIVISSSEPLDEGLLIAALQWVYPREANMADRGEMVFKELLSHLTPFLKERNMQGGRRCYQIYHESFRDWLVNSKSTLWDNRQGHAALFVLFARVTWMLVQTHATRDGELSESTARGLEGVEGVGEGELDVERRLQQELERFSRPTGEYLNFQFVQNGEGGPYLMSLKVALTRTDCTVETAIYEVASNLSKCSGEGKATYAAEYMRSLMEIMGLSVDASTSKDNNALVKAIMLRNQEAALLLIIAGADINCTWYYNKLSYMHVASKYGCAVVIELLIEKGATVGVLDEVSNNVTVMFMVRMVLLLLLYGIIIYLVMCIFSNVYISKATRMICNEMQ